MLDREGREAITDILLGVSLWAAGWALVIYVGVKIARAAWGA